MRVDWLYSSISSRYGSPCLVNGIAFCGIESDDHLSRLISRVCGLDFRA